MRITLLLPMLLLWSGQPSLGLAREFLEAQQLVEQTVTRYPNLVRLTIHAVPAGEADNRIIACNVREKLGRISDPEDLEAMKTGTTTVLREGGNLDVTAPILDQAGSVIAAIGITLALPPNAGEEAAVKEAETIARELGTAIQTAGHPLW
jgi:hypothetical protein